ncbi:hypothetical protein QTA56_03425 [Acinetobacter sp. VNH17]|uniref:Uncharacterized protein n=1 Tax=Acinetobacter thutiue TaxID=2998078 RepID=A0ABT7WKS4_9GAMM|nr:hypothetical protein [Acinetobacter thutiue]MCY6411189.1 hypothetical protein [Acinetobacter thutiue]MDN0013291.1 hypothetical protein [Acinetobacter thutiue]
MRLIRKATTEAVPLENGFLFSDEFDWKPVEQNIERAIDGTLIVQEGKKKSGRPITLLSKTDKQGWIKRSNLSVIQEWSALQGEQFTLVFEYPHDIRQFNVIFNHAEGAIEATPVRGVPSISEGDFYRATFRFLEVP